MTLRRTRGSRNSHPRLSNYSDHRGEPIERERERGPVSSEIYGGPASFVRSNCHPLRDKDASKLKNPSVKREGRVPATRTLSPPYTIEHSKVLVQLACLYESS